jgi:hypothetical protein
MSLIIDGLGYNNSIRQRQQSIRLACKAQAERKPKVGSTWEYGWARRSILSASPVGPAQNGDN